MTAIEETRNHLKYILNQVARQQNIENYEIILNTEGNIGDGFVGQFFQGAIRSKTTGEILNVAIKKAPLWEIEYYQIFANEILFYEKSFPVLNDLQKEADVSKLFNSIPNYFCGELETGKEFLAMENLKNLGYVMFDKKQFMDEQHLEMIFETYGKFHALSFVLRNKNLDEYKTITEDYFDIGRMMVKVSSQLISSVSAAVSALDPEIDKTVCEELQDFANNVMDLFIEAHEYKGEHRCLIHGDCWSNNMLFKYSESGKLLNVMLIDFQLAQDNTPIHDLSYFFYSGASKTDFDKLDYYLEVYHQSFSKFAKELGVDPDELLPLEVFKEEWKEYGLYGIIMGIYLWQVKLTAREEIAELTKNNEQKRSLEENFEMMERMLQSVHLSDLYRKRTTDILRHVYEYGILNKKRILQNKQ